MNATHNAGRVSPAQVRGKGVRAGWLWLTCALAAIGIARAQIPTETVLHSFASDPSGGDPYGTPVRDSAGNLYGTTLGGGGPAGVGLVYKLDTAGKYHVLYSFAGSPDGANPYAGVVLDSAGNMYGTTYYGGIASGGAGKGVVYRVSPSGQETVLYTFTGGADGANPYGGGPGCGRQSLRHYLLWRDVQRRCGV
jgi:uncharacterized repeat protein (TIGR03803 family)